MDDKLICFAEVIESSLAHYRAQSWDYTVVPPYGSLIVAEYAGYVTYAVVYASATGSDDQVRQVQAYQKTQLELMQDQPQIFALLRTSLSAVVIGYKNIDTIQFRLPPVPVPLHTFVRYATVDELRLCVPIANYLHLLFAQASYIPIEQLVLALVGQLKQQQLIDSDTLCAVLHTYLQLSGNDYAHVRFFARQLEMV